ncbi:MAG: hypothetical protein ABSF38_04620 [Verrucomicrobiota bacterium]|jgi:hypothetical protein
MKTFLKLFYLVPVLVVLGIVASLVWNRSKPPPLHVLSGPPFASAPITNLTANLFTPEGRLGPAANDVFIEFRDAAGKLVDVGDVQFELRLETPGAITHCVSKVLRTSTPGQYRANVAPQIVGQWTAKLSFARPGAQAQANFLLTVK